MKNELFAETSPYLLQHAHNPVHWQPWGEKALALAKSSGKPLLVSIGYSACHWCHVMERESFENESTAALMNEFFINVKIDREERPDIDHIYMDAVQAITGSGGWPLNVFLTPDGKPFYGGTYFPPEPAFNRASWPNVLESIHDAWTNRREEMEQQAETLTDHLRTSNNYAKVKDLVDIPEGTPPFTKEDCLLITENLLANADTKEGGFGKAPKFPQTFSINCLLQSFHFFNDDRALLHAELSLEKMLTGGIYDQLAGGLCRYSTDAEWLAPHFEKMLYDNALFIIALSNAYMITKKELYRSGIERTCAFLLKEMKGNEGGYFAALDADSEGEEGKFYVWQKDKTETVLGKDAAFFNAFYDVSEEGNWEGKNILRILKPLAEVAETFGHTVDDAEKILAESRIKLLNERSKRIRPGTDDKILLGWNALLVTAFSKAYAATGDSAYRTAASDLFAFIETAFRREDGAMYHTYKEQQAKYPAFLDDYAYLAEACIHLQEITAEDKYLHRAKEIMEYVTAEFSDEESGYFFFTPNDQTDVIVRKVELYDGATPSANSVTAKNLLYLSLVFDHKEWHQKAVAMISSLKNIITKHPGSFGIWAAAAINIAAGINEIAIIGTDMMPYLSEVLPVYMPNRILQSTSTVSDLPLMRGKPVLNQTSLYLCRGFSCESPVYTTSELLRNARAASF